MHSLDQRASPPRAQWRWLLLGGLSIAVLDAVFACTYWHVSMARVFRSIAAGLVGLEAARGGGVGTAILGGVAHLFIATMFVVVYAGVGRRVPVLLRRPFVYGPPYGLVVYAAMNHVVVPLSRIGPSSSPDPAPWVIASIVFHVLVVGTLSAWFAQRACRARTAAA